MKALLVLLALSRVAFAESDPRAGFHVGGSLGGVYLPTSEGISALVFRGDFNWGRSNGEVRLSPVAFVARDGDDPSFGVGGLVERRWYATTQLGVGVGAMLAMVFDDGNRSAAIGPCATPIAVRLGDSGRWEIALDVFLLHNVSSSSNLPGGYVTFTYLSI